MMHYRKGENVETEITKADLPFKDCLSDSTNFLWMHVKGGTKVHNVISYAKNALDKSEYDTIIWSGKGGGVIKTVSCAEILKRHYALYQVTRTCYVKVEEHWLPQKNDLEEIIVTRQIPSIHILQSLTQIDDKVRGVQKPNEKTEFWHPQQQRILQKEHEVQQQKQLRQCDNTGNEIPVATSSLTRNNQVHKKIYRGKKPYSNPQSSNDNKLLVQSVRSTPKTTSNNNKNKKNKKKSTS